jgi:hypothetical protein
VLAALVDSPNLLWNASNGWATFAFQFARLAQGQLSPRFLPELIAVLLVLCSPFNLILGTLGISRAIRDTRFRLIAALALPASAYFLLHALHDRVQGNWPSFLLPELVVAAAVAARLSWARLERVVRFSRHWATPTAALILVLAYTQAVFGLLPSGRSDPFGRLLGFGFPDVAKHVEETRASTGAYSLLVTDYASAGWFSFYRPSTTAVIALGDARRWGFAPETALPQRDLYVAEERLERPKVVAGCFQEIAREGGDMRSRRGVALGKYAIFLVQRAQGRCRGHLLP